MKKITLLIAATVLFATQVASGSDQADRPTGVVERNWVQISPQFGFVIDEKREPTGNQSRQVLIAPPDSVSAELMPPAKGYFVVKTSGGWRRIVIAE